MYGVRVRQGGEPNTECSGRWPGCANVPVRRTNKWPEPVGASVHNAAIATNRARLHLAERMDFLQSQFLQLNVLNYLSLIQIKF